MADVDENVDSMETDSASEGKAESLSPPKRPENLCCYSQQRCDLEKLKGFDFCHKHILEDKASPFKPCSFVSKTNGKKCTNPAPKMPGGQKTYCLIHTRDSELRKALEEKKKKKKRKVSEEQEERSTRPPSKPGRPPGVRNYTKRPKVLDLGTEHRRDDVLRVESSWHGDYESDSESLDNDMDDPLRHAGVWTAEEATKMCRDKLLRLRSMYMSQFERLKHVHKNKRRKYLLATTANEEDATTTTIGPKSKNETLSAFHIASKGYNKRYRTDALLQKQSKEKRLGTASRHQILPQQRCVHYTDGNRCTAKVVPLAKFCLKHICHDPSQHLFLPCSQALGTNQSCGVPVPNVLNHDKCILHLPHTNDLSVRDLEQELQHAKEEQIIKENEREDRRKAAIAQAAHEAMLSEIAKSEALAAEQEQKSEDCVKTSVTPSITANTQQASSSSSALDVHKEDTPLVTDLSSKLSDAPTTNLQIKIQPEKQPEIVCKDTTMLSLTSKLHDRKLGDPPLVASPHNASAQGTALQATVQSQSGETSISSKEIQDNHDSTAAIPLSAKPSFSSSGNTPTMTTAVVQGLPNKTPSGTQAVKLNSLASAKTISSTYSVEKMPEINSDVAAESRVPKLDTKDIAGSEVTHTAISLPKH